MGHPRRKPQSRLLLRFRSDPKPDLNSTRLRPAWSFVLADGGGRRRLFRPAVCVTRIRRSRDAADIRFQSWLRVKASAPLDRLAQILLFQRQRAEAFAGRGERRRGPNGPRRIDEIQAGTDQAESAFFKVIAISNPLRDWEQVMATSLGNSLIYQRLPHIALRRRCPNQSRWGPFVSLQCSRAIRSNAGQRITSKNRSSSAVCRLPMSLLVNDPPAIRHVLLDNAANYRKDAFQRRVLSAGLGDGLLSAEGEQWRMPTSHSCTGIRAQDHHGICTRNDRAGRGP